MGLLDGNYEDERLTKKVKPAIQGGGYNYLGKEETVTVPKRWLSDPDHVVAELAYITPREQKILLDADLYGSLKGKPNRGPSGIMSLQGDMGSVGGGGSSGGGGNSGGGSGGGGRDYSSVPASKPSTKPSATPSTKPSAPPGGGATSLGSGRDYSPPSSSIVGNDGGYVDRIQRISSGVEPGYTPTSSQPFGVSPEQAYNEGKITVDQYREAQQVQDNTALEQPNLIEKAFDLYKQYSPLGIALKLGGSLLDKIGGVSKSLQNKAIAFDLQNKLEKAYQSPTFDPFSPDASVTQLEQDLARAKAGEYSQQEYQDRYAPQMNQTDQGGSERDAMNQLTPYAPYAISGQTPQDSMVNQYFANMNMSQGSPLSSDLQTSYNNAKNSVNSILGITPTNQQFGYSAQPYGLLSSTNMADNPYNIPYLQQRGLI
jgi:hypothetical protein